MCVFVCLCVCVRACREGLREDFRPCRRARRWALGTWAKPQTEDEGERKVFHHSGEGAVTVFGSRTQWRETEHQQDTVQ